MTHNIFSSLTADRQIGEASAFSNAAGQSTQQRTPEALRPSSAQTPKAVAKRPTYRVLVIEDDPHIARLILVNLNRAGLEGRSALGGAAGLEEFSEHPPHLVLLDLMMPGMDGFQVCEKIRAKSSVPIIIMTARLEPIHQMRGFRLGADDYVLKPFDPQLLVARIIAHLRRVYRYDKGQIQRKDAYGENAIGQESQGQGSHATMKFEQEDLHYQQRRIEQHCVDVLAHMPEGWAGCTACNYMGPLSQFPRLVNGQGSNTLACPNCRTEGHIKFTIG